MRRISILAGVVGATAMCGAAQADPTMFDGTMIITAVTAPCAAISIQPSGAMLSLLRPHFKASDPKAAFIILDQTEGGYFQIEATTTTTQMQGSAPYAGSAFIPENGLTRTWIGTYDFTVSPSTVTATTDFVEITGTIAKFGNAAGCTLTIDAVYLRRL